MTLVKGNLRIGVHTRFGPNWPGKRCLAKTRRGTACQRAAYKHNGRCALHGGRSTGPRTQRGLQRISEANLKKGGRQRTSWLPSTMRRKLGVGFYENSNGLKAGQIILDYKRG